MVEALRDHLPLLLAVDQVVVVLHRDESGRSDTLCLRELPGVHAAGADVAGFPGPDDVVECLHRLLDRRLVVPAVDLVEVDVVELEALQRGVDRGEHVLPGEAAAVLPGHRPAMHLRRDDVLLPHPEELAQEAAGDDLALASVVDVGGVEEDDSAFDRPPHDRLGSRFVDRPLAALMPAEAHHPQAHTRDTQAGAAEVDVLHPGFHGSSR